MVKTNFLYGGEGGVKVFSACECRRTRERAKVSQSVSTYMYCTLELYCILEQAYMPVPKSASLHPGSGLKVSV